MPVKPEESWDRPKIADDSFGGDTTPREPVRVKPTHHKTDSKQMRHMDMFTPSKEALNQDMPIELQAHMENLKRRQSMSPF